MRSLKFPGRWVEILQFSHTHVYPRFPAKLKTLAATKLEYFAHEFQGRDPRTHRSPSSTQHHVACPVVGTGHRDQEKPQNNPKMAALVSGCRPKLLSTTRRT